MSTTAPTLICNARYKFGYMKSKKLNDFMGDRLTVGYPLAPQATDFQASLLQFRTGFRGVFGGICNALPTPPGGDGMTQTIGTALNRLRSARAAVRLSVERWTSGQNSMADRHAADATQQIDLAISDLLAVSTALNQIAGYATSEHTPKEKENG